MKITNRNGIYSLETFIVQMLIAFRLAIAHNIFLAARSKRSPFIIIFFFSVHSFLKFYSYKLSLLFIQKINCYKRWESNMFINLIVYGALFLGRHNKQTYRQYGIPLFKFV